MMAAMAAVTLTSCSVAGGPDQSSSAPHPTDSSRSPLDAASLAAKVKVFYGQYTLVSSQVARDGGKDPERLRAFDSPNEFQGDVAGSANLRKHHYHATGKYISRGFTVQSVDVSRAVVKAYVCIDSSKLGLVDGAGNKLDIAKAARLQTILVTFSDVGTDTRIERDQSWSGASVC